MKYFPTNRSLLSLTFLIVSVVISTTGFAQNCPSGTSPVYRFYNTITSGHFFTIDENEKNTVLNTLPSFRYEGVGFCASKATIIEGGARWGALNKLCCSSGPSTYTVTVAGVTKRSFVQSCNSDPTFEGFASTTSGRKSFTANVASASCPSGNFSGTVDMANGACYLFALDLNGQNLVTDFYSINCPASANENNMKALQQETLATPMAIFPMMSEDGSTSRSDSYQVLQRN